MILKMTNMTSCKDLSQRSFWPLSKMMLVDWFQRLRGDEWILIPWDYKLPEKNSSASFLEPTFDSFALFQVFSLSAN